MCTCIVPLCTTLAGYHPCWLSWQQEGHKCVPFTYLSQIALQCGGGVMDLEVRHSGEDFP